LQWISMRFVWFLIHNLRASLDSFPGGM
jgi:hypothetical protein